MLSAALRPPEILLSSDRIAGVVNNPLSFSRTGIAELVKGRWRVEKLRIALDSAGNGEILYKLTDDKWEFHFFLLSSKLPEEKKLDRNFASTWEAMGALCQGAWTAEREAQLRQEIPKQAKGRVDYDTLMSVRANRSARLFDHVVDSLVAGQQPDIVQIASVGYIMRTTAFTGNGHWGSRPFAGYESNHPMKRPYHAQIWTAFLLREYVFDLVNHIARARNPHAAQLSPEICRYLGIGNSAATGLVSFIFEHPLLMHRWVETHEAASAEARARRSEPQGVASRRFRILLAKALDYFDEANSETDGAQTEGAPSLQSAATMAFMPGRQIRMELKRLVALFDEYVRTGAIEGEYTDYPWQRLQRWLETHAGAESVEIFNALVLELYPEIVDCYTECFGVDERFSLDPCMTLTELDQLLKRHYRWSEAYDAQADTYFWYHVMSAPLDLRRGRRASAPKFEFETPIDVTRCTRQLRREIQRAASDITVAALLFAQPQLRHIIRRVQLIARAPYGEPQINFLDGTLSPFGPVRLVLSFYGMEKLEAAMPKLVRGALLQGAPIAADVAAGIDGVWPFPLMPRNGSSLPLVSRGIEPFSAVADPIQASHKPAPHPASRELGLDVVVAAPNELRLLLEHALQAAGLDLGTAQEASAAMLFKEALHGSAFAALTSHIEQGLRGRAIAELQCNGLLSYIEAHDAHALTNAFGALDLACSHAVTGREGVAAALVAHAQAPDVLQELVLRCAERGLLGLLIWHSPSGSGFAAAASVGTAEQPAPWFIDSSMVSTAPTLYHDLCMLFSPSITRQQSPDTSAAAVDHVKQRVWSASMPIEVIAEHIANSLGPHERAPAGHTGPSPSGFLLICSRLDSVKSARLFELLKADQRVSRNGRTVFHSSTQLHDQQKAWQRHGLRISRPCFEALSSFARKLLVPDAEEAQLRPGEDIDPLKIF
jgi:hypothetical protein